MKEPSQLSAQSVVLQIEDTVEFEGYRPVLTEYLARVGAVMVAPL